MTLDKGNTDKLAEFRADAQRLGVRVAPPSVNGSGADFDVRYDADGRDDPLRARRHQGRRRRAGARRWRKPAAGAAPSRSLSDFARRVDPRQVNKKALECLASAGAFDEIEPERAAAFAAIEPMLAMSQRRAEERSLGQVALFGDAAGARR